MKLKQVLKINGQNKHCFKRNPFIAEAGLFHHLSTCGTVHLLLFYLTQVSSWSPFANLMNQGIKQGINYFGKMHKYLNYVQEVHFGRSVSTCCNIANEAIISIYNSFQHNSPPFHKSVHTNAYQPWDGDKLLIPVD